MVQLAIIIPALNESQAIGEVLDKIVTLDLPGISTDIIVVDDGSTDETASISRSKNVCVLSHLMRRGVGAAMGTGIEAALRRGADIALTFDADGQHSPEDISNVIEPILKGEADVVLGSRMIMNREMPLIRRIANHIGNLVTLILFDVSTTDSQSGLRAFSRSAAQKIKILANNYEVCSQICGEVARHNLRLVEVPIRTIYTDYSMSKGQGFIMGLRTLFRMILFISGRKK